MYARVTTYELDEQAGDATAAFEAAIERIRALPGLVDASFLIEREQGARALTITTWATLEAMEASRVAATRARSDAAREVSAEVTTTCEYAVRVRGVPEPADGALAGAARPG
jgi:heme-degrading monooxygenase HmoA